MRLKNRILAFLLAIVFLAVQGNARYTVLTKNFSDTFKTAYSLELVNQSREISQDIWKQRPGFNNHPRILHNTPFQLKIPDWLTNSVESCISQLFIENEYIALSYSIPLQFTKPDITYPFHHFG